MNIYAAALLSLLIAVPDAGNEKEMERLNNHIVRARPFWADMSARPFSERFGLARDEVIEYVGLDNRISGSSAVPKRCHPDPGFLKDVKTALQTLPPEVASLSGDALAGIVFMDDLGSTGYAEYVMDGKGNPAGAFLVLNCSALGRKANEWFTWRENTPFKSHRDIKISGRIEEKGNDSRANAMQYIILHELGHVLSAINKVHPRWDRPWECKSDPFEDYPFLKISWLPPSGDCKHKSRFDGDAMTSRGIVRYYSDSTFSALSAPSLYRQLARTDFPALYSTLDGREDFAESFAAFVHSRLLKKPFIIEIYEKGKLAETFDGCWGSERCREKEAFYYQLLRMEPPR